MRIRIPLIIILVQVFTFTVFAQDYSNVDSLEIALYKESDPQKKMDILIEITDLILSSDPDKALNYANQTLELADKNNNLGSELLAYLQIGEINWIKSDFRTSLEMAEKAKSLAKNLDMDIEFAESLILISKIFRDLGDYEKSLELNFQALKIFEKHTDKNGIAKAFYEIARVYHEQENDDKALELTKQALEIARETQDLAGISRGLNNVAAIYFEQGEFDKLEANLHESIIISKQIGNRLGEGVSYINLGFLYRVRENFDTAIDYYRKADQIFTELNNFSQQARLYISLSVLYSVLENVDSSFYYANLTYEIGRKNGMKKAVYDGASRIQRVYIKQNDSLNAFRYSIIAHQMKDSLDSENSKDQLSKVELLYEFDKRENENKIKQQRKEYTFVILGTTIAFLLIILVIFIIMRNRLKRKNEEIEKRKLKSELENRNKELASNVMGLVKKNKILSEIADKLMDIRNKAVKEETKSAIIKIARELHLNTDDEVWDEFEIRFKQVHGEFYEKLITRFPDLSPNEQKICAFLRLNMSTKEISDLTGQRIVTLEVERSRLRKKLGLTHTKTNLVTFLSQI